MDTHMIDISECRRNLANRREARARANRTLWRQAQTDAARLVEHIAREYRPECIIQWGSVLDADRFGPCSDIDIGIDGEFTPETWFRLLGELWDMTSFPVDIVDLRRIEPEFTAIIKAKGKVVYARGSVAE